MNEEVATKAFGLKEGEGEAWWWGGVSLATIKATGKETGGRYTLVEVLGAEGEEAPLHVHHREDEAFWILEGELTFQVGDETIRPLPDRSSLIPRASLTASPSTLDQQGCCGSSRPRASRSSSTLRASRPRSAPCRPRREARLVRRRWSS